MTHERRIASYDQRRASDPAQSAWVSANAGSGKTHVLVERVIRLMLAGTEPDKILCITFTKAAAAEMAARLHDRLAKWVALEDSELAEHIGSIGHELVTPETLARARGLFTLALETPGGLKIQTIHAFCERLLQLFPVEAGVAPGFDVMDERSAAEMLASARRKVISEADANQDPALTRIVARAQIERFEVLLRTILGKRSQLSGDLVFLRRTLGLEPLDTPESVAAELAALNTALYLRLAEVLEQRAAVTDRRTAANLRLAAAGNVAALRQLFLTDKSKPRALASIITRKSQQAQPWAAEAMESEQARVVHLLGKLATLDMIEATDALLTIAQRIIGEYERSKRRLGRYDFEDLIARTHRLLTEQASSAWVLYKLDGGIDHILIDEAQDTSPAQWQIVRALAEEFFSGLGARSEIVRTLFVVGDRKQSIFSFQGADPEAFEETRLHFRSRIQAGARRLENVTLSISYRSTQTVLDAVDRVFSDDAARSGLNAELSEDIVHQAVRKGDAGLVELWPVEQKDERPEHDPWQVPVDRVDRNHPARKLARRIAGTIRAWLEEKRIIGSLGRPVRPGDILILVRTRNDFFSAMIKELHRCSIPVAGADRVTLNDHIAVQDLLALGQFAVLAEDDYALACVLKSPLISRPDGGAFTDEELFQIAHGRGKKSLWQSLQESEPCKVICERLLGWIALSRSETPFGFYSRVLSENSPSVRQNMLSRLGAEAADLIDAFLNLALDYEQRETPSLQGFLGWFLSAETEIKRDMEQGADEVRIMTVHGAKGLESNIVFLPDTCAVPDDRTEMQPLMIPAPGNKLIPFWRYAGGVEAPEVGAIRADMRGRRLEEYRRQLYVALTRARDELYICGYASDEGGKAGCWHELAERALAEHRQPSGVIRVEGRQKAPVEGAGQAKGDDGPATPLPPWAVVPPRSEWTIRELSPRRSIAAHAAARGLAMHKLFQLLPDIAPEKRNHMARRILARRGFTADEAQAMAARILAIIDHPEFAPFFATGGLAEIPLMAALGETGLLVGRIDRVVLTAREALILDFKTDRGPPPSPDRVSPAYMTQLAAYRAALVRIFPDRTVKAGLLWTETPSLMIIPSEMLDAVMSAMSSSRP